MLQRATLLLLMLYWERAEAISELPSCIFVYEHVLCVRACRSHAWVCGKSIQRCFAFAALEKYRSKTNFFHHQHLSRILAEASLEYALISPNTLNNLLKQSEQPAAFNSILFVHITWIWISSLICGVKRHFRECALDCLNQSRAEKWNHRVQ